MNALVTGGARSRLGELPILYRIAAVATGTLTGAGLGLMLVNRELVAAGAACALAVLVVLGVRLAAPPPIRRPVGAIVGLSFAMHVAAATFIYFGSLALGRGGFVTGDDATYARLSWAIASYLLGDPQPPYVPPAWAGDEYLLGTWVYLESTIFVLFGPRVLLPLLLNAAFSAGLVLLILDLSRRLFGNTAALLTAAITSFYPSLVLWSSLNLKDALALFLIALCLWCLTRFQSGVRWRALAGVSVVLVLMESLRWYVFVGLAIIVPIAVVVAPRLSVVRRIRWSAGAALMSASLIAFNGVGIGSGSDPFATLESTRQNMAVNARTGFIDLPVRVQEGDGGSTSLQSGPVRVQEGDGGSTSLQSGPAAATLRHLPTGIAYALFAPFPWALRRVADWLTLPEMLLWYGLLAALPWTLWRARRLWRSWSPLLLFVAGILLILALTEGNVGTLYRHRAMVIPFVAVLAAPSLVTVGRWIGARFARPWPV